MSGSYNIRYVIELDNAKLVIRVPTTSWGYGRAQAADASDSKLTMLTMPGIYALDTSINNKIDAPSYE
jgi:hypothetical protein